MTFLDHQQQIPGLTATVGDFWRWAYSDILSNRNRSIFAEFMVGNALGVVDKSRVEWDSADLYYKGAKIEVKSSAYLQSWPQKKLSAIRFDVDKAIFYNWEECKYEGQPTRCAHVYVFCHYAEKEKARANVLDVPAWDFYVISTEALNRTCGEAKSLSLMAVQRIAKGCKFDGLKTLVDEVLEARNRHA